MSNTIEENNSGVKSSKNEQSTNYESGKTETQVISAPGEVKRLTASVIIDGNLDTGTINTITQSVENAIGLNSERGDKISVASMDFDPAIKMEQENQIKEFNEQLKREKIIKLVMLVLGIILVIGLIIFLVKFINKKREEKEEKRLDVIVGTEDFKNSENMFKPVDFGNENEKLHLENEVKNYAKEKPDQVVEVIRSWLSENER